MGFRPFSGLRIVGFPSLYYFYTYYYKQDQTKHTKQDPTKLNIGLIPYCFKIGLNPYCLPSVFSSEFILVDCAIQYSSPSEYCLTEEGQRYCQFSTFPLRSTVLQRKVSDIVNSVLFPFRVLSYRGRLAIIVKLLKLLN